MATETKATFTPGPWTICLGSGQHMMTGVAHFYADGRAEFIADCLPDYALEAGRVPADHRPNMQLIAAAPDLLAVLHECAELLDDYSDVNDGDDGQPVANKAMSLLQAVEAAIAKAEGK